MRYLSSRLAIPLGLALVALPLIAVPQEPPHAGKRTPEDPSPRLDLHGDPLPEGALARFGTVRYRVPDGIRDLALTPDNRHVVTISESRSIRFWDIRTGRIVRTLTVDDDKELRSIAVSPGGKWLLTAGTDARLWDLATGTERFIFGGHGGWGLAAAVFSPDGKMIATSGDGLRLWDLESGKPLRRLGDGGSDIAFTADGEKVVTMSYDRLSISDIETGERIRQHFLDDDTVRSLSPDGSLVAEATDDGRIDVREPRFWQRRHVLDGHQGKGGIIDMVFSRDGGKLASSSRDGTVRTWSLESRKLTGEWQEASGFAWMMAFSPDGERLAWVCGDTLRVRDLTTGKTTPAFEGHRSSLRAVAFHPGAGVMATGGAGRTVRLWDVKTGRQIGILSGHTCGIHALAFTSDGKRLASGSEDSTIRIWEVPSGKCRHELEGHGIRVKSVAFSPDDTLLASGDDHGLGILWETRNGTRVHSLESDAHTMSTVVFHPDGAVLFAGSEPGIGESSDLSAWEVRTGTRLATLKLRDFDLEAMSMSADARWLAMAGSDGNRVLELASGRETWNLDDHSSSEPCVAFVPAAPLLALAGDWGNIVFGTYEGAWKQLHEVDGTKVDVNAFAFSADGTLMALALGDSTAVTYPVPHSSVETGDREAAIGEADLERLWSSLALDDPVRAYKAVKSLAMGRERTIRFIEERAGRAKPPDRTRLRQLILDLDSDEFEVREEAAREILRFGAAVRPCVEEALEGRLSAEQRSRLEGVLNALDPPFFLPPGDLLRTIRAIDVLERIGSESAQSLLKQIEGHSPWERARKEARAALARLEARRKAE